jgi:hypothetical protein
LQEEYRHRYPGPNNRAAARYARLVLVTPDGTVVGCLPPFPVGLQWWQEADIDVTILRLLDVARDRPHGVEVTYLAENAVSGQGHLPDRRGWLSRFQNSSHR